VLKWMPNTTSLDFHRDDDKSIMNSGYIMPTVQDIKALRNLCPELECFGVDIRQSGFLAKWDMEIIGELCRFKKPLVLSLHVR
ncbi:MAG: hypothetical protein I4N50_26305, partial [Rhizobium sp.]|nr:hypothetical protein [Rhizobium sp.]